MKFELLNGKWWLLFDMKIDNIQIMTLHGKNQTFGIKKLFPEYSGHATAVWGDWIYLYIYIYTQISFNARI